MAGRAGIGSALFVAADVGKASRTLAGETFDIVHGEVHRLCHKYLDHGP
jgi:hypothetical protein